MNTQDSFFPDIQAGVDASAWAGDTVTITVDIVNKEGNRYEKMMEKQIEIG